MSRSRHGLICAALCALGLLAGGAPVWSQQPQPVQHEYRIRHFKTEGGVELPEVRIVYGTYGHLDPAGDNAILLPSHYMAEMHGYAWLVGPGKALDPGKLFLITSELFGNGRSSSPSNTPEPFSGPRFPVMTIRDKVEPEKGIQAFSLVWTAWLFSQEWWRRELWRSDPSLGSTLPQVIDHFRKHFIPGADANNLILQMRTWESNDVGNTPPFGGNVEAALRSIKVPVLYMPSATDLYFPVTDARYEAAFIPHCQLAPIPSLWGHPAGAGASPADAKFINEHVAQFLKLGAG